MGIFWLTQAWLNCLVAWSIFFFITEKFQSLGIFIFYKNSSVMILGNLRSGCFRAQALEVHSSSRKLSTLSEPLHPRKRHKRALSRPTLSSFLPSYNAMFENVYCVCVHTCLCIYMCAHTLATVWFPESWAGSKELYPLTSVSLILIAEHECHHQGFALMA